MATDDTKTRPDEAYEVIAAQPSTPKALELDGNEYKFRDSGMMRMKDRGLAMAMREKYGRGITVTKVRYPHEADRGHRFTFSVPEMPWKRKDADSQH